MIYGLKTKSSIYFRTWISIVAYLGGRRRTRSAETILKNVPLTPTVARIRGTTNQYSENCIDTP